MDKDILKDKDAHTQPFKVPEEYFDTLATRIRKRAATPEKRSFLKILAPYAAVAASFALVAVGGSAIIRKNLERRNTGEIATGYYSQSLGITQDVNEEDIVNYLISSDISCNELIYMENYE